SSPAPDPTTLGGVLEAWERLLAAGESAPTELPAELTRLLEEAGEVRFATPEAHLLAARELLGDLARHAPRRGKPPAGSALWGRLTPLPERAPTEATEEVPDATERGAGERRVVELDRVIRMKRVTHRRREDKPLYHMF